VLSHTGIRSAIIERVRFARARFGQYDLIDFVVVLIGYGLSGEPTLQAFYERLAPFAECHFPQISGISSNINKLNTHS